MQACFEEFSCASKGLRSSLVQALFEEFSCATGDNFFKEDVSGLSWVQSTTEQEMMLYMGFVNNSNKTYLACTDLCNVLQGETSLKNCFKYWIFRRSELDFAEINYDSSVAL